MEQVGVQLIAGGADAYLSTLTAVAAAETKLASAAEVGVRGVNALDDSTARAAAAAERMAGSYVDANGRLRDAQGRFISAADAALALGHDATEAAGDVTHLGAAAERAGQGADDLGDKSEKGSRGIGTLQQMAIGAARKVGELLVDALQQAGQAVVQFVGETISKAGDFESGMNRFASVTGDALAESGQSLEDFKQLFISLGRDLPVSTAEVQQAAIEMAKGGIEPATIAAGGLRDVLNLAAAGEVGIAQAAEIAAKQLGVWVDSAASATEKAAFLNESVDLLSQAANASTVDVDDLALGLANSGKSADLAGLSFRETVTSMALISSGFSSAADAGTSFKTFIARLQPATDSQAEAFKRLNLLTAEGASVFYDATGSFIGMDKAAGILKQSLSGMSDAQKEAALNAAFGADAIRTAGMLADAGAEGYQHMADEMAKAGSAAQQAARKQQGFNVAMDNMMGSVEALQITIGSALLPALTKLVNLASKGINAITDYADATIKGETALAAVASTISSLVVPALAALTAGAIAYGVTAMAPMLVNIPAMTAVLLYNTAGVIANAAAMALAVAPYLLIAAAVGGVVYALNDFNSKVADATTQLLNSRQWWLDSADAIEDYGTQVGAARDKLGPYAATITALREQIQGEIEDLGRRSAAGLVSEEQYTAEMAVINQHRAGLIQVTQAYNEQEQAILKQTTASMTATSQAATLQQAEADMGSQASLTAKDIEDLGKTIQDTFAKGQQAVQAYATTQSEFLGGVETRQQEHADKVAALEAQKEQAVTAEQKKGIDDQIAQANAAYADQEQAAAASYARQQAAQTQHLGQMLIDYTVAQAQLGNISKARAAEITAALESEYGLQESSVATTFLNMAGSIDKFASSSGGSIQSLIGDLHDQQQAAADTQRAMDEYAKTYTATQTNNFLAGKADARAYAGALEALPKEINVTVRTRYVSEGGGRAGGAVGDADTVTGRAVGGPMQAMRPYVVGEEGPEIVTPGRSSYVTPTDAIRKAAPSMAQMNGVGAPGGATTIDNSRHISMPVYTNETPAAIQQSAAIVWSMLA